MYLPSISVTPVLSVFSVLSLLSILSLFSFFSIVEGHNEWRLELHEVTTTLFVVPPTPKPLTVGRANSSSGNVNNNMATNPNLTKAPQTSKPGENLISSSRSRNVTGGANFIGEGEIKLSKMSSSNIATNKNANNNNDNDSGNNEEQSGASASSGGSDPIERLFSFFFGAKEDEPLGFKRTTVESAPEFYPATTTRFAAPVQGDSKEVSKYIRPLLAQTYLEKEPVTVSYDAQLHGWDFKVFHKRLRDKRSGLVVAKDKEGNVFGGFNPKGWVGLGDERAAISSFLFTYRGTTNPQEPIKLIKIGGADMAIIDREEEGIRFGYEDLWIRLNKNYKNGAKLATSKLGLSFAGTKGGLFGPTTKTELVDLKVYTAKDPSVWQNDNWKK